MGLSLSDHWVGRTGTGAEGATQPHAPPGLPGPAPTPRAGAEGRRGHRPTRGDGFSQRRNVWLEGGVTNLPSPLSPTHSLSPGPRGYCPWRHRDTRVYAQVPACRLMRVCGCVSVYVRAGVFVCVMCTCVHVYGSLCTSVSVRMWTPVCACLYLCARPRLHVHTCAQPTTTGRCARLAFGGRVGASRAPVGGDLPATGRVGGVPEAVPPVGGASEIRLRGPDQGFASWWSPRAPGLSLLLYKVGSSDPGAVTLCSSAKSPSGTALEAEGVAVTWRPWTQIPWCDCPAVTWGGSGLMSCWPL